MNEFAAFAGASFTQTVAPDTETKTADQFLAAGRTVGILSASYFWLEQQRRRAASWIEHGDINMVLLATSLLPDGFLQV